MVGCIHGDEPAGIAVTRALRRLPGTPGARLILVDELNPDGRRAGARQNARGVDLNRNFSVGFRRSGRRGETFYSGPRPFSEPETRALRSLVLRERPTVTIWFHQHLNLVDLSGGNAGLERRFARRIGLRAVRLAPLAGTATRWQNRRLAHTSAFVVELPAGAARPGLRVRLLAAIRALEGHRARSRAAGTRRPAAAF